jgi:hypothetical protein
MFFTAINQSGLRKRSLIAIINEKCTIRNLKKVINQILKPFYYLYFTVKYKEYPPKTGVIYINPEQIYGCMTHNIYDEIPFFKGDIKGGEWDIMPMKTRLQNPKYLGLIDRYVHNKPWIETRLFTDWYIKDFNEGKRFSEFRDIDSLAEHYRLRYDSLFNDIKEHGLDPAFPLPVIIDQDGNFIWTYDGNHRLYMAMILNIDFIPVRVIRRHKKFQLIKDVALNSKDDKLYNKFLNHPDILIGKGN